MLPCLRSCNPRVRDRSRGFATVTRMAQWLHRWTASGAAFACWNNLRQRPDRSVALARYGALADRYESTTSRIRGVRARLIELLGLRDGESVLDIACGTGAMLPDLALAVGPRGRVVGIEQCPQMAALARRVAASLPTYAGTVEVVNAPVETFAPSWQADAAVLSYTHDVLQNPDAVARLLTALRPGARLAVAGLCLADWRWAALPNLWVLWRARHYLTTWHGLHAPWRHLCDSGVALRVTERYHAGTGYVACGHWPGTDDRVRALRR